MLMRPLCASLSFYDDYVLLQEAFSELDKDGDGHLTPKELHAALRNTGALAKAGLAAEIDPHVLEVRPQPHCLEALTWTCDLE